jgi:hypothetical protein
MAWKFAMAGCFSGALRVLVLCLSDCLRGTVFFFFLSSSKNFLRWEQPSSRLRIDKREDLMTMRWCARLCLIALLLSLPLFGQTEKDKLTETILHQDGLFWDAYNQCDVDKMSQFFWPDIEFYHDKGGPTIGASALIDTIRKNLCGNPNSHLRREAVPDTAKVFPLEKNGEVYGAVLYGEHYFYVNDKGKPEYRDGMAKYFDVWLLKDGAWKMARVVSYDHHQAPPVEKK